MKATPPPPPPVLAVTASTHGSGGVAFMAHVAGFVTGLVGVFFFKKRERADGYWA